MKVELKELTKIFPPSNGKRNEVVACGNLNYEFKDGKLTALLGPSGCGKSTTLYLISGLEKPTSGTIMFGENDVTNIEPEHRGVGLVFQNYALYPHLTVYQNIQYPLKNFKGKDKLSKEEMHNRILEAAKLVQIEQLLDRKPAEMSGGQQQRVAIARAIVKKPKVLLLDEPLSNLDARLRLQTREEIRRIQRETNITTIFVTHDQDEAMSISDEIVVLKQGVFQQAGNPQEVYDNPTNLFVAKFLGVPPINVFRGTIKDGKVFIGDEAVMDVPSSEERNVYVGVRPEGFVPCDDGKLTCKFDRVEVMGRDISIISSNENCESDRIRSIIDSKQYKNNGEDFVKFKFDPNKVFVFDRETEERICF